jgi:spore coat polysaccharide biosynthesis protein SpsF
VKTGVFLQARLGSRRLPRKAVLSLDGITILEAAMLALRRVPVEVHALLTDAASASELRPLAEGSGFALFEGPAEDVLRRFCLAARSFGVERVVRATGDNPLVSRAQTEDLLSLQEREAFDLGHFVGPPIGTGVEVVTAAALRQADSASVDPYEHEHITTYLYRNPARFVVAEVPAPERWSYPRGTVTIDTAEDYSRVRRIFSELYRGEPIETEEVISWLKRQQA